MAEWVGSTLSSGRYQVVEKIGAGGMGFVYRSRDNNLKTNVVIKVPRPALLGEGDVVTRYCREIRSLVRLSHPHIVEILDVGEHDGVPFAVMQYLGGEASKTGSGPVQQTHNAGFLSKRSSTGCHTLLKRWIRFTVAASYTATSSRAISCSTSMETST